MDSQDKKHLSSDGFCCSSEPREKMKERKIINKYFDFAKELKKKKRWNTKMTEIPIIVDALETVPKSLKKITED